MGIVQRTITSIFLVIALTTVCPVLAVSDDDIERSCEDIDEMANAEPSRARLFLDTLYTMGCLGGQEDSWDLAQHVEYALEGVPTEGDPETGRTKVAGELRLIRSNLRESLTNVDRKQKLQNELGVAIDNFEKDSLRDFGPHKPKFWEYHPADGLAQAGINVNEELKACQDKARASDCLEGYKRAKLFVSYATVTKRALDYFSMRDVQALAIHVNMLGKRWEHYFNDARSQFIWELAVNGWRYKRNNKDKEGLLSPPNYQWIILHPSIGLEYVDTNAGDRFHEAIVIEGLGINRWTWKDSKMKLPLGISVIGVYGDRSSVPQFAYGALFHYNNNLSLGVTRRGSETGVILSLDLAKLFLKQSEDKQYKFKYRLP